MIFETDGMRLVAVRHMFNGPCNDLLVCQDTASPLRPYYTLLVVTDSACAKQFLHIISSSEKPGNPDYQSCLRIFSQNEFLCFLFPYRAQRRLSAFAESQLNASRRRETMAVNLVMECLETPFPYPFLYLILVQDNVNLLADDKVYFTPFVDLAELDENKDEASCVDVCARLLLQHLDDDSQRSLKTLVLLRKKLTRSSYQSFPELYKDIRLAMLPDGQTSIFARIRRAWHQNKKRLFNVLLVIFLITIVLAILILLGQLIFGDVVLFSMLENKFRTIGTEILG